MPRNFVPISTCANDDRENGGKFRYNARFSYACVAHNNAIRYLISALPDTFATVRSSLRFVRTTNPCFISFSFFRPLRLIFVTFIPIYCIDFAIGSIENTSFVMHLQIMDVLLDLYRRFFIPFPPTPWAKEPSVICCDLFQALASRWSTFRPPWTQGSRSYWRPAFSERG